MSEVLIPEHRRALAVDFYCIVARSEITDRGDIRSLAADMFGIPRPYDKDRVDALVTYIATHIFSLAGVEEPRSGNEAHRVLADFVDHHFNSTILLDKTA